MSVDQTKIIAKTAHPLATYAKQLAVIDVLNAIDNALESSQEVKAAFDAVGYRGLAVSGSVSIPPSLRIADDLDLEIIPSSNTDNEPKEDPLEALMECVKHKLKAIEVRRTQAKQVKDKTVNVVSFDVVLDVSLKSINQRLKDGKISTSMSDISFTQDDIDTIVRKREEQAESEEGEYHAPNIEQHGEGIRVVVPIEINLNPQLNMFGYFNREDYRVSPKEYTDMIPDILFPSPVEQFIRKLFASQEEERAHSPTRLVKDLIDVHLRDCNIDGVASGKPLLASTVFDLPEFRITRQAKEALPILARVLWPTRNDFYANNMEPNFKYADPNSRGNQRGVKQGLRKLRDRGMVGVNYFGIKDDEDYQKTAESLLNNAWSVWEQCFGVKQAENYSKSNPKYEMHIDEATQAYWQICMELHKKYEIYRQSSGKETREEAEADLGKIRTALRKALAQGPWNDTEKDMLANVYASNVYFSINTERLRPYFRGRESREIR